MPTVPERQNFEVAPTANAPQFNVGTNSEEVAGHQMQGLGEAGMRLGGALGVIGNDVQTMQNEQAVRTADTDLAYKLNALQFDPDNGIANQQGEAAYKGLPAYIQAAKDAGRSTVSGQSNVAVQRMLEPIIQNRVMSSIDSMTRHAGTEFRRWQFKSSEDRANISLQSGANDYANEVGFQKNLGAALEEVGAQAEMQGWDASTAQLKSQQYTDAAYKQRYDAWRVDDPVGALGHFQRNQAQVSPVARVQLYHELFEAAAPVLAEQFNASGGSGVVDQSPGSGTGGAPVGGGLSRGQRNNNPGNIVRTDTPWQGEVQGTDPRFASFATPEAGIRAMGKTLETYQDAHGLNTVASIISRWAPASENNSQAYQATVASALGVKPNDQIDVHDPATMTTLVKSMIKVENGRQPYTDAQISKGLSMVGGGVPDSSAATPANAPEGAAQPSNAWRNPDRSTGNAMIDSLPSDWKLHVLQLARNQSRQDMVGVREQLRGKVLDAQASYLANGTAPNPPTMGDFVQAYGQMEGPERYRDFAGVMQLGQQLQQVKTLPSVQLEQLMQSAKPVPGPGFDAAQRNYETLGKAVDWTNKQRQADPIAYAQASRAYGVGPLDLNNLQSVTSELAARGASAAQIASDYGTAPRILSRPEAQLLADTLKASPVEGQKRLLSAIAQGVNDLGALKVTMQAIAPDQPVMALAGIYQARGMRTNQGADVADLLLRGQAILTPNKKTDGSGHEGGASLIKMPEAKFLLSDFNSVTGEAFIGKEQAADLFMQASKAIYAAKSAEAGDYSGEYSTARWKDAIKLATGGVQSYNGSKIVMPYGLGMDEFQDRLKAQVSTIEPTVMGALPGELMRLPLENVGDGRYLFKRGAGYAVTKDGQPLIVDLNKPIPRPPAAKPSQSRDPSAFAEPDFSRAL